MRSRKSAFRENRVSSLNKITWDFKLGDSVNVNLAQHFNSFYVTGLFLTARKHRKSCSFLMFLEGIEKDNRHYVG